MVLAGQPAHAISKLVCQQTQPGYRVVPLFPLEKIYTGVNSTLTFSNPSLFPAIGEVIKPFIRALGKAKQIARQRALKHTDIHLGSLSRWI